MHEPASSDGYSTRIGTCLPTNLVTRFVPPPRLELRVTRRYVMRVLCSAHEGGRSNCHWNKSCYYSQQSMMRDHIYEWGGGGGGTWYGCRAREWLVRGRLFFVPSSIASCCLLAARCLLGLVSLSCLVSRVCESESFISSSLWFEQFGAWSISLSL